MKEIKNLQPEGWTWECSFIFQLGKASGDSGPFTIEHKDWIFKAPDKGLFGILKKDLSSYTKGNSEILDKQQMKEVKIDFIKKCGDQRTPEKNKILDEGKDKEVKTHIPTFMFIKQDGKVLPYDDGLFSWWFEKKYTNSKTT